MRERLNPEECQKITTGNMSCEGCPLYTDAQASMSVTPLNDKFVLELSDLCPDGAKMDIESLGVRDIRSIPRARQGGFVR